MHTLSLRRWLEPTLFQPFLLGTLIPLALSEFVRGALILSLLPTYGRTVLGFAVESTALALSVHYLVDTLLRTVAGWWVDRLGQRVNLLVAFTIAMVALVWLARARSLVALVLAMGLLGVAAAPVWPAAVSAISLTTPKAARATFMGYLYLFWLGGIGLGPIVVNLVAGGTYKAAFWLLLAVEFAAWGIVFVWVRPPYRAPALPVDMPTPANTATAPARSVPGGVLHWRDLWNNVRTVAYLFPGMFAQTFAVSSLLPNFSLYVREILGVSGAVYSAILITLGVGVVSLLIPAGRWVDRRGKRPFLVGGLWAVGALLGLYPLGVRGHVMPALSWTFVTMAALGIAYAVVLPAWNAVLDGAISAQSKATLWGIFMTVEGLGSACGPLMGGWVWDQFGPMASFWLSGGVMAVMGWVYLFLPVEGNLDPERQPDPANFPRVREDWTSREERIRRTASGSALAPVEHLGGKQKT